MIVTGRTSTLSPTPDATGTTGGPDDQPEEGIDERLLRELAERVRSERLRSNLQRSASQRLRASGRQACSCFTDDLDDQILPPYLTRPMLARDQGR